VYDVTKSFLGRETVVTMLLEGVSIVMTSEGCAFRHRFPRDLPVDPNSICDFDAVINLYERNRHRIKDGFRLHFQSVAADAPSGLHLVAIVGVEAAASRSGACRHWSTWDEVVDIGGYMGVRTPGQLCRGTFLTGFELRRSVDDAYAAVQRNGCPAGGNGVVIRAVDTLPDGDFRIGKLPQTPSARGLETEIWIYPQR
jgi:hypothetical protein